MKKFTLVAVLIAFILNFSVICYADEGSFVNSAVLSVSGKIEIPSNYTEFNSKLSTGNNELYAHLSWFGDADGENGGGRINVTVDKDFVITEFSQYFYGDFQGDYKLSKLDAETAFEIAADFAKRACPEYFGSTAAEFEDNEIHRNFELYEIMFYRYENGLPCYENYISVTVNAYNGAVSSMKLKWDDCSVIRSSRPGISLDAAKVAMYDKSAFFAEYAQKTDGSLYVRYSGNSSGTTYINAYNGELFEVHSKDDDSLPHKAFNMQPSEASVPYYDADRLYNNRYIELDSTYSLDFMTNYSDFLGDYVFLAYSGKNNSSKIFVVDAENGDIRYYTDRSGIVDENNGYTQSQCKSAADSFCREYVKKIYGYCRYLNSVTYEDTNGEVTYYYNYPRFINGVSYADNGILIGVSAATGKVVSVETAIDNFGTLPSGKIISKDEAFETYIENCGFTLQYIITTNNYKNMEMRAVYAPDPRKRVFVDALTGFVTDGAGENVLSQPDEYYDISSDISKDQINTLLKCGVFDREDRFRPLDNITLSEFLLYMARCVDCVNYKTIEDVSDSLISKGIVTAEELETDGFVTTEKGIKYLISYLGYSKLAEAEDTYITGFIDEWQIDKDLVGYAAIAKGLKIFSGNAFLPKENLKRNVAAQIFYNLINN